MFPTNWIMKFWKARVGTAPKVPPSKWEPIPESPGYFSSGIRDLDVLLGGGYRVGSVIGIEADPTVYAEDFLLLELPPILNFLSVGRGALLVPPAGLPPARIRERVIRHVPEQVFDERTRVVDYSAHQSIEPWIVPMARLGRIEAMRAMVTAEKAVRGPGNDPFLEASALDTLENMVGAEAAIRMMTHGLRRSKEVGNIAMVMIRSGSWAGSAVSGMADDYLVLSRAAGAVTVRGIRPTLPPRRIQWTESEGILRVELGLPG